MPVLRRSFIVKAVILEMLINTNTHKHTRVFCIKIPSVTSGEHLLIKCKVEMSYKRLNYLEINKIIA